MHLELLFNLRLSRVEERRRYARFRCLGTGRALTDPYIAGGSKSLPIETNSVSPAIAPSSSAFAESSTGGSGLSIATVSLIVIPIIILFVGSVIYLKLKAQRVSKKMAAMVQRDEEKSLHKAMRRRRESSSEESSEGSSEEGER